MRSVQWRMVLALLVFLSGGLQAGAQTQQAAAMAAPPAVRIPGGVTRLDDIGLYRVTYRYLDGHGGAMPLGWTGNFEDATGISCTPFGTQDGKSAFLLHPIWRGGTGDTDQIFRLSLPKADHIQLRFAIAMRAGYTGPGKSDGATFRVYLNDNPLLDRNQTQSRWISCSYNLTPYAGQTVTLRFETDPGPRQDPSFDFALWGDRTLEAEGAPKASRAALLDTGDVPPGETRSDWHGTSPTYPVGRKEGFVLHTSVALNARNFLEGWTARLLPALANRSVAVGTPVGLGFGAYLDLVAPDGKIVRSDSPEVRVSVRLQSAAGGVDRRILTYHIGARAIRVQVDVFPAQGHSVKVEVRSDDPAIAAVHFGDMGPVPFRRQILVPYLGAVSFLPDVGLFACTSLDYAVSQASDLEGTTAHYLPLTDGRRNSVRETAYFALSNDLRNVLPTPPNPPSPFRNRLADRIVLDSWGGPFVDNAAWLRELASYHLTHLLTIAHVWQNGGYDNKLPNVLPALESLGGDAGMRTWVQTAVGLGEPIALHENYVDFYPNAAAYYENDVARDSQDRLIPAWKNLIQSYAVAPTAILKYARMFTPNVHARYGTNGSYLDVHSAVAPWFHVDFRADRPGAGRFHTVWEAHRDLWKLFREVHGDGPVLGEGNQHWYWSGLLDGVEAQFGTGVPSNGGETAPLFVDFDLLKIHPLQFNHGMGYVERWINTDPKSTTVVDGAPTPRTQDQYRMQEVAYGHAGFVGALFVHNLPFVWQEHNLLWPVTSRYATSRPTSIRYEVDGQLLGTNAAIAAESAFDRVRIGYENGLTLYANSRAADWTVPTTGEPVTLPQYGWLAVGAGVRAYTALRQGVVADYAETPTTVFANARTTVAAPPSRLPVQPGVANFAQTGSRRFRIWFTWNVGARLPDGEQAFVHYTRSEPGTDEGIVFQSGTGIATAPETWKGLVRGNAVDVTLPDELPDGSYSVKVGLYAPKTGERLRLSGDDDGSRRITVGTITVSNGGETLRLRPAMPARESLPMTVPDRESHINTQGIPVDFGKLITTGSVLLERDPASGWLLTPFPRDTPFLLQLRPAQLDRRLPNHPSLEALDNEGHSLGQVVLHPETMAKSGLLTLPLNTIPGAVRYRLR